MMAETKASKRGRMETVPVLDDAPTDAAHDRGRTRIAGAPAGGDPAVGPTRARLSSPTSYPALLPLLLALTNPPDALTVLGVCTSAPANASCRSPIRFTTKENSLSGDCSTVPSSKNAPLWCSSHPYLS